jgi:hypothetical protein|tara:strand:- start:5541 stop:5936 length:396 start_codon:yes stop_codon:yes gene_type:complete
MQTKQSKYKTKQVKDSMGLVSTLYDIDGNFMSLQEVNRNKAFTTRNLLKIADSLNKNPNDNKMTQKFQSQYNFLQELMGSSSNKITVDGLLGKQTQRSVMDVRKIAESMSSDRVFENLKRRDAIKLNMDKK